MVFFTPNERFTHINGLTCYGGVYVRQVHTFVMASSILQLKLSTNNFYCAFICTTSNQQILIVGTFDFENLIKAKLSDFIKNTKLVQYANTSPKKVVNSINI